MSWALSRRRVLRGLLRGSAVAVGLPLFEAMLNENGTALAAGAGLPLRYGLFFWGNGLPCNMARPHLTVLRALGIDAPSYGFNGGETSNALPFLLA